MTGQASAVAASPFNPNQVERAEGSQPSQQLGITHGGGGKALGAEQATGPVERGSDMDISMGVYTASDGGLFYDGQGHPFHG
jgi:hypothetical protein